MTDTKIPQDVIDRLMAFEAVHANEDAQMASDAVDEILRLRAALRDQRQAVPDGWKLPMPNSEYVSALKAITRNGNLRDYDDELANRLEELIEALSAPTPPAADAKRDGEAAADIVEKCAVICEENQMSWADDVWNTAVADCAKRIRDIKPNTKPVDTGAVAWAIYIVGEPADVFLNKDKARLEFIRRQTEFPDATRKLVPLFTHPSNDAMRKALEAFLHHAEPGFKAGSPWVITVDGIVIEAARQALANGRGSDENPHTDRTKKTKTKSGRYKDDTRRYAR